MNDEIKKYFRGNIKKAVLCGFFALWILLDFILLLNKTSVDKTLLMSVFSADAESVSEASFVIALIIAVCIASCIMGILRCVLDKRPSMVLFVMLIICQIAIISISASFDVFKTAGKVVFILNLIFVLIGSAYNVTCTIINGEKFKDGNSNNRLAVLMLGVVSLFVTLILLVVPFCKYFENGVKPLMIPLDEVFGGSEVTDGIIVFAVVVAIVAINAVLFIRAIMNYSRGEKIFIEKVKGVVALSTLSSGGYFVASIAYCLFIKTLNTKVNIVPISILPFLCMAVVSIIFAYFWQKVNAGHKYKKYTNKKIEWAKIEFFVYATILSVLSVIASLTDILNVSLKEPEKKNIFVINGMKTLTELNKNAEGFRIVAFFIVLILVVTGALLLASLVALVAKSKMFKKIALAQSLFALLSCLFVGMLGKYYEIVQKINEITLVSYFEELLEYGENVTYNVKSNSYFWFMGAMVIAVILIIRAPYSKLQEKDVIQVASTISGAVPGAPVSNTEEANAPIISGQDAEFANNNNIVNYGTPFGASYMSENQDGTRANGTKIADPCPAFSELDKKAQDFENQTKNAEKIMFKTPSLQSVVQFVVEYARDSRLHLSYKAEDIATFIAGLGATRLTILQGMSGTGKTSLPKIFTEALFGNCEIIEVESSWRDKNELLGYYNEFSKTYTPKKFTQALYKAKLNPKQLTFIVLDEMNLSRVEYYFSDFLSLMENEEEKREIKLLNVGLFKDENGTKTPYKALSDGHTLKIPSNVWFIGTANRDESTFEISDKVYDRAHTMNFNKRAPKVNSYLEPLSPKWLSAEAFMNLLQDADKTMSFDIESCQVIHDLEELLAPYNISFGNRVAGQIEKFVRIYCACFPASEQIKRDAIETILLSKVVSKLEYKSIENKERLASELKKLGLNRCSEFVLKLNED